MKAVALFTILTIVVSVASFAQPAREGSTSKHPAFRMNLDPLVAPGYEAGRELRLALFDSPMSRLELAAAREQWSLRNVGPSGWVLPFQQYAIPQRLDFGTNAQRLLLGPWNAKWNRLTWQEKVAAGAQAGVLTLVLIEIARHVR